jgi:excisionase family DNA binding protein
MTKRIIEPKTLTVEQAGRILGTCYATTLRAAKSGQIPCVRVGRKFLVLREPFETMLGKPSPSKNVAA